jgi:hypothetical protein
MDAGRSLVLIALVICLCVCMIKCAVVSRDFSDDSVVVDWNSGLRIIVLGFTAVAITMWYSLPNVSMLLLVSIMISLFFPYFGRTSKHRTYYEGELYRSHNDRLVTTSVVYLCAALVALYYRQVDIALNCCVTFIGSSAYHRYREMAFFNLDNIFATSLLVVFAYTLCSAYYHHEVVFTLGFLGTPVALFLLAYCGSPAEITLQKTLPSDQLCCMRMGRPLYDAVHNMWHLISGGGPILAVWYFDYLVRSNLVYKVVYYNPFTQVAESVSHLTVLPFVALAVGLVVNLLGNYYGIMPLE